MYRIAIAATLLAGLGLTLPPPAQAGDEGWAAFGGFVGGLIVADAGYRACDAPVVISVRYGSGYHRGASRHYRYRSGWDCAPPPRVYYSRRYAPAHYSDRYRYGDGRRVYGDRCDDRGYRHGRDRGSARRYR